MTEGETISLEFGALVKPISEQLAARGIVIEEGDATYFNRAQECIVFLHINKLIPDSARDCAERRLMRQICCLIHKERES